MSRQLALDDNVFRSFGLGRVFKDSSRINSIDFCRTDDLLITASDDDSIKLYNIAQGKEQTAIASRKYGVQNICFTHSPDLVIYASRRGTPGQKALDTHALRYHDIAANRYVRYFHGHTAQVTSLCMSPKSDAFVSASLDKSVRLWDLRTNICQGLLNTPGNPTAAIDQQGLVFAVATESGCINLYDIRTYDKGPFDRFIVPDENNSLLGFSDIKFSNNGNMILAAVEGRLYLLDAYKGSVIKRFNTVMTEGGAAGEAAISADNKYLIAGCDDSNIRVWHIESGVTVATWTGHAGVPGCLKTAPRRLMVASACNALCMWVPNLHVLDRLGAAPH